MPDESRGGACVGNGPGDKMPAVAENDSQQVSRGKALGREGSTISRRCERAVVTAYRELRACGSADLAAFQACTTLYRIHHPEATLSEARRLVAEWIDHHVVRQDAGPTPGCDCD